MISISNIAWDIAEEDVIAGRLREMGVSRVDIAPGKYLPDPIAATREEIAAVRRLWARRGFAIEGMQALLFGAAGLNLFDDADDAMLRRLAAICRIGGEIGARKLTFGSPRMRDRGARDDATVERIAGDFFRRLGDAAVAAGVVVCLEPNPRAYACNFMTTTAEAAAMVERVAHPGIALQLDVGAIAMNREAAAETIAAFAPLIGHVHASEPMLAPLGTGTAPHDEAGAALRAWRPDLAVTIEMTTPAGELAVDAVAAAVLLAQRAYDGAAC